MGDILLPADKMLRSRELGDFRSQQHFFQLLHFPVDRQPELLDGAPESIVLVAVELLARILPNLPEKIYEIQIPVSRSFKTGSESCVGTSWRECKLE